MAEAGAARRGHPLARALGGPQVLHCRFRRECLDEAVRRGFPGFSCLGCHDAEPAELCDVVAEHDGLIALAGAVLDPARRPQIGQIRQPRWRAHRTGT